MPMPRTSGRDPFASDRNPASQGPDADPRPFDPNDVPHLANDPTPAPANDDVEPPQGGVAPGVGKQEAFSTARQWGAISREAGQALTHVSGSGRTAAGPVNPATGERWDYDGLSLADLRAVRDRATGLSERWERHALDLPAEDVVPDRGLFAPDLSALHRVGNPPGGPRAQKRGPGRAIADLFRALFGKRDDPKCKRRSNNPSLKRPDNLVAPE